MVHETDELRNPNNIHDPVPRTENLVMDYPHSLTLTLYRC
jgi:hypothetical protein